MAIRTARFSLNVDDPEAMFEKFMFERNYKEKKTGIIEVHPDIDFFVLDYCHELKSNVLIHIWIHFGFIKKYKGYEGDYTITKKGWSVWSKKWGKHYA